MNSLNDLEYRIQRLEALLSLEADAPLVFIRIRDQRKGSQDQGRLNIAVVPGPACGHPGQTLTRDLNESENDFLLRCDKRYSELYE